MLNDIAPVHDASTALLYECGRATQYFFIGSLPTAAHENWTMPGDVDHLAIVADILCGIRFNEVRPQLDCLTHERKDLPHVAIDLIAARLFVRLEYQRFYHQRHTVAVAVWL